MSAEPNTVGPDEEKLAAAMKEQEEHLRNLKALAYDAVTQLGLWQQRIQTINEEINRLRPKPQLQSLIQEN